MSFWQSFQGLLGPQGFQGFQAKDLFDNERWKRVPRGPEWENPNTMRTPTNVNYIPRGAAKPGASIATTKRRPGSYPSMAAQYPPRQRLDPRQQMMQDLARDKAGARATPLPNKGGAKSQAIPTPSDMRGRFGRGVDTLLRETGDFYGPIVDDLRENMDIVGDTKKYWGSKLPNIEIDMTGFGSDKNFIDETTDYWRDKWGDLRGYIGRRF